MAPINVAVLVGSLRKESIDRELARAVEGLASAEWKFGYVQIGDLPLHTQEFDAEYPPVCQQLKHTIQSADAHLFVGISGPTALASIVIKSMLSLIGTVSLAGESRGGH